MQNKIRQTALNLLARRDHTQQELAQKLQAKGYPTGDINQVINHLNEKNLINETRFIESYINARQRKGIGPLRIQMELKTRGIAEEMIAEQLKIADNAWLIEIRNVWKKHFKAKMPEDFKQRAKLLRFLSYRGFTQDQINTILKDTYGNDE